MTAINLRGVGVSVTEAMQGAAKKQMAKIFSRFEPVSHDITVKPSADGIEIAGSYHTEHVHKNVTVTSEDFYSGMIAFRDALLRQLEKDATLRATTRGRRASFPMRDDGVADEDE